MIGGVRAKQSLEAAAAAAAAAGVRDDAAMFSALIAEAVVEAAVEAAVEARVLLFECFLVALGLRCAASLSASGGCSET
jgi:hypothetical protein